MQAAAENIIQGKKMRSSKGQGLSMQTIVLAILALVVLVVLVLIITGRFSIFSRSTDTCASREGVCSSELRPDSYGDCDFTHPIKTWTSDCPCVAPPEDERICKDKKLGQCCLAVGK